MSVRMMSLFAVVMLMVGAIIMVGCDNKPDNYTTRTIVYVSYMNDGMPYLCDVLSQGDSLYYQDTEDYKFTDDCITDGNPTPLPPFTGNTSVLIPENEMIEAWIVIVPFDAKTVDPLVSMQYTNLEIYTNATVTFRGHEIQTDREITFTAGLHVNFVDPLITKSNEDDF